MTHSRRPVPPRSKQALRLLIAIRSLVVLLLVLVGLVTAVWRQVPVLLVWLAFTGWFAFLVAGLVQEYRRDGGEDEHPRPSAEV